MNAVMHGEVVSSKKGKEERIKKNCYVTINQYVFMEGVNS